MNYGKITNYVLFGGGELLLHIAEYLQKTSHIVFVITSPRHASEICSLDKTNFTFIECLEKRKIEYIVLKKITHNPILHSRITEETLGISFGAAWIFKELFIRLFNNRLVNCHGSYLPQNRGGGGFSWRIMRDDHRGISLIHQIDSGVDTGDIILFEEYIFPVECQYPVDYQRYSIEKYKTLLERFFHLIDIGNEFTVTKQQEYFSTYWPRLATDIHGYIDWNWNMKDIERFIHSFDDPYSGALTFINGQRVHIKKCYSSVNDGIFHPFQSGIIYRISSGIVFVSKENGSLLITDVFNEDGLDIKPTLKAGDRFYTPIEYLEAAKQARVVYSPDGLSKRLV
jgi:methionyl-tRNA formyltransferase